MFFLVNCLWFAFPEFCLSAVVLTKAEIQSSEFFFRPSTRQSLKTKVKGERRKSR